MSSPFSVYRLGNVVTHRTYKNEEPYHRYGHIIGFGRSEAGELLIQVQWEYKVEDVNRWTIHGDFNHQLKPQIQFIHPGNLQILE